MKYSAITLLIVSSLSIPTLAYDKTTRGFYAGGGMAMVDFRVDDGSDDEEFEDIDDEDTADEDASDEDDELNWNAVEIIGGYKHSPYVGGEARLGFASENPDLVYTSFYYRTESVNDTAKVYLLFGYTLARLSFKFNDEGFEEDSDMTWTMRGISYGAGVGFPVSENMNLNLEYRMLMDGKIKIKESGYDTENADGALQSFSINLDYRF
jgi:hypothetical protein